MQTSLYRKSLVAFSVVVLAASVGVFGAQALAKDGGPGKGDDHYTKDQCKDNGWKNFKNPDGSQKFKNQGQCIAFFNHEDGNGKDDGHSDGSNHDNDHNGNNDRDNGHGNHH